MHHLYVVELIAVQAKSLNFSLGYLKVDTSSTTVKEISCGDSEL